MQRLARRREGLSFFFFVFPAVAAVTLFVMVPFAMNVYYSFHKWNGIDKSADFIGLKNFIELFTDDRGMGSSLTFTFLFALCMVILVNCVALFLAVLLESKIRGKGIFRVSLFIPNIISPVVIGFIWKFTFMRVFDSLYSSTNLSLFGLSWLGDSRLAFFSVVIVSVWQALGFYTVVYIAGLQSVPGDVMEAAVIDGAGPLTRFFKVTLPLILPSVTFCVFYAISNSFKTFEIIFSLTGGGPGTATTPLALDIYNTAFNANRFGYGSAKSIVLFVLVAVISVVQISVFQKREVEL